MAIPFTPVGRWFGFEAPPLVRLMYNMAYIKYSCTIASASAPGAQACLKKSGEQFLILYRLATDYSALLSGSNLQCDMQARLFEAEIEFPPFSFWKDSKLYDATRMIACLRK
jgi:hypothetical protein